MDTDKKSNIVEETGNNLSNEAKNLTKKKYKQKFSLHWLREFKWASERNGSTFCTICSLKMSGGAFHLRRHANSSHHISNITKISHSSSITESIKKMTLKDRVADAEIKIMWFICENNLSFRVAGNMVQVCKFIFNDSQLAQSMKMERTKCSNLAINRISLYLKKKLAKKLISNKFSIIIDEKTDISTNKSLVVIVRLWLKSLVQDRFFDLMKLRNTVEQFARDI